MLSHPAPGEGGAVAGLPGSCPGPLRPLGSPDPLKADLLFVSGLVVLPSLTHCSSWLFSCSEHKPPLSVSEAELNRQVPRQTPGNFHLHSRGGPGQEEVPAFLLRTLLGFLEVINEREEEGVKVL